MEAEIQARIEAANEKTFKIIEDYISNGYLENLAKLLVYLPEERRNTAIQQLPEYIRNKVCAILNAFDKKKNSDADVLSAVGTVLKTAGFYGKTAADEVIQNDDMVFVNAGKDEREKFFQENPLLSMNVEYYLMDMELLCDLDNRAIQKWLREVDRQDLAMALKGCSEKVKDKVLYNLSNRAAEMFKEDMEFMGPVRKSDVLEKQKKVIRILKKLCDEGEIVLPYGLGILGGLNDGCFC